MAIPVKKNFFISNKKGQNYYIRKFLDFLFEIKNKNICESPFQILLTNLDSKLKGFFMPKEPKWYLFFF